MNKPNPEEIRTKIEQRRRHDREQARRREEAMDAFAVRSVQALTEGLGVVTEQLNPGRSTPESDESDAIEPDAIDSGAMEAEAKRAIEARRLQPPSVNVLPLPGEPQLRAALRGVIEDYAQPLMPSEGTLGELQEMSGIALDKADVYGLWADLELEETLAAREAMLDAIDVITDRAESVIVAELLAAQARIAREYPEAPRPDSAVLTES